MQRVSFIMIRILEMFLFSRGGGYPQPRRVVWIDFGVSIVFFAYTAGRMLELYLDEEAVWEVRVFKSRARKMVSVFFDFLSISLFGLIGSVICAAITMI